MKKRTIRGLSLGLAATYCLALGTVVNLSSCGEPQSKEYTINGTITGNADGKKVYLKSSDKTMIDSTNIEGGVFHFTGSVDFPSLYTVTILKNDTPSSPNRPLYQPVIPVFLENSTVEIAATLDSIPDESSLYYGSYNYANVDIKGSAAQETYRDFLKSFDVAVTERSKRFDDYIGYLNPGKGKEKGPASEGIALVTKVDEATEKRNLAVKTFIKDHPENVVALYIAKDKLNFFSVSEIDEILASLSPKVMETAAGAALIERANEVKKTAAGAMFADLSFNDHNGNPVKLSDHLGKGKYVLLEFWASWCGPCRADIPHLKSNYELYHPEGFEIVSVSMDSKKEDWLKAIDEEKMNWLQISDLKAFDGDVSKVYNFNGIPTCLLIGPDGKIVTRNMRGSWMDKKLIELYGDKFL